MKNVALEYLEKFIHFLKALCYLDVSIEKLSFGSNIKMYQKI